MNPRMHSQKTVSTTSTPWHDLNLNKHTCIYFIKRCRRWFCNYSHQIHYTSSVRFASRPAWRIESLVDGAAYLHAWILSKRNRPQPEHQDGRGRARCGGPWSCAWRNSKRLQCSLLTAVRNHYRRRFEPWEPNLHVVIKAASVNTTINRGVVFPSVSHKKPPGTSILAMKTRILSRAQVSTLEQFQVSPARTGLTPCLLALVYLWYLSSSQDVSIYSKQGPHHNCWNISSFCTLGYILATTVMVSKN